MDYVFILGKNEKLSIAEILSYLNSRNIEFRIKNTLNEAIILQTKSDIDPQKTMLDLGGVIKICKLIARTDFDEILNGRLKIKLNELSPEIKNNTIRFGVSVYANRKNSKIAWNYITNEIKKLSKELNLKTIHITPSKRFDLPVIKHFEVLKKLLNKGGIEIVANIDNNFVYISKTLSVHDPYGFRKRDIGRPRQRTIYSISPRLAKILINLSSTKPRCIILDPFCGIGTILQEALLMDMNIKGVDKNPDCIESSFRNLEWIKKQYHLNIDLEGKLIVGDSCKLSTYIEKNSIDAVVTEPYLGPPLKRKPTKAEAQKILQDIRPLYMKSLKEINKVLKLGRRVSIVFPNFETQSGIEMGLDIENLSRESGFVVKNIFQNSKSIIDADPEHKTRREICVLEKSNQ
jgi:tRNA G10  N-methylase Trm11